VSPFFLVYNKFAPKNSGAQKYIFFVMILPWVFGFFLFWLKVL
jgi:hypothetical protein